MRNLMNTILTVICLLTAGVASATVTCSASSCTGPAGEMISKVQANNLGMLLYMAPVAQGLGCGPSTGTPTISMSNTIAHYRDTYAMLLSGVSMNKSITITMTASTGLSCLISHVMINVGGSAPVCSGCM